MRKASKHSAVLMLMGVLALGLVGAAYTLWYEKLTLEANITTGTLDADVSLHLWDGNVFDNAITSDVGTYPGAGRPVVAINPTTTVATMVQAQYAAFGDNWMVGSVTKPKTICNADISSIAGDANGNTGDSNVLSLSLYDLFPYAGCEYSIDIHNDGTVPFHIALTAVSLEECAIVNDEADDPCVPITAAPWSIGLAPGTSPECAAFLGSLWPAPAVNNQIDIQGTAVQLHATEEIRCTFKLILDQADVEGKGYRFKATWQAYQWNELPAGFAP